MCTQGSPSTLSQCVIHSFFYLGCVRVCLAWVNKCTCQSVPHDHLHSSAANIGCVFGICVRESKKKRRRVCFSVCVYACVYRVYGHARGICLDNPVSVSVSCFKWMLECSCMCVYVCVFVCGGRVRLYLASRLRWWRAEVVKGMSEGGPLKSVLRIRFVWIMPFTSSDHFIYCRTTVNTRITQGKPLWSSL